MCLSHACSGETCNPSRTTGNTTKEPLPGQGSGMAEFVYVGFTGLWLFEGLTILRSLGQADWFRDLMNAANCRIGRKKEKSYLLL